MVEATSTTAVQQIAERLESVQERIAQACQRVGRRPEDVTLIAVSKTFPIEVIAAAIEAGLRHFGENKVQELMAKEADLPSVYNGGDVTWHMVGHLQRNKARDVAETADWFHALDSPRLAKELNKRARNEGRVMPCYVQVNVSGEDSKYGIDPARLHAYLDDLASYEHLSIRGLMTLAEPTEDPEEVRPQFRWLRTLAEEYNATKNPRVDLTDLSMGMSGDFEVAIEEGATHVRIGSAIFGPRDV